MPKKEMPEHTYYTIRNFIEYWTSDNDERERMYRALEDFEDEVYEE